MFKFKAYGISLLLTIVTTIAFSQSVITLDQPESGFQKHCATEKIYLLSGYSYIPQGEERMQAQITGTCEFDYFVIDTENMLDILSYQVTGAGLNENIATGNEKVFFPVISPSTTEEIEIEFIYDIITYTIIIELDEVLNVVSSKLSVDDGTIINEYGVNNYLGKGVNRLLLLNLTQLYAELFHLCVSDNNRNWTSSKFFDEDGNLVSSEKSYFNYFGNPTQNQAKNFSDNTVIASQTIYDVYGRKVLNTLPAPIYEETFCYKTDFIKANGGTNYDYTKFDIPNYTTHPSIIVNGEVDKPIIVEKTTKGTVGWYYSDNNNEEPYVSTTNYPYSRVEFDPNNPGKVKRASAPHDELRMGKNRETKSFSMPASGELNYVFGYVNGWVMGEDAVIDIPSGSNEDLYYIANKDLILGYNVVKNISVDADGYERVSFTDVDGKLVAECYSGTDDSDNNVNDLAVTSFIKGNDFTERYVDIHLPSGVETSIAIGNIYDGQLNPLYKFNILDLDKNIMVYENTDGQSISLSPGYYRIINIQAPVINGNVDNIAVRYDLNYYDFTLYYYDRAGRLIASVSPNGIDNNFDPNIDITIANNKKQFVQDNPNIPYFAVNDYEVEVSITPTPTNSQQFTMAVPYLTEHSSTIVLTDAATTLSPVSRGSGQTIGLSAELPRINVSNSGGDSFLYIPDPGCGCPDLCASSSFDESQAQTFADDYCASLHMDGLVFPRQSGSDPWCFTCEARPESEIDNYYIVKVDILAYDFVTTNTVTLAEDVEMKAWHHSPSVGSAYWTFDIDVNDYINEIYALGTLIDVTSSESINKVIVEVTDVIEMTQTNTTTAPISYYYHQTYDYTYIDELDLNVTCITNEFPGGYPEHQTSTVSQYNSVSQLLKEIDANSGIVDFVYSEDGLLRFSRNEYQKNNERFSYVNYDELGRTIESGEYNESGGTIRFQNHYAEYSVGANTPTTDPTIVDVLAYDLCASGGGTCSDVTYIEYDYMDSDFNTLTGLSTNDYKQKVYLGNVAKTWNETVTTWYSYNENGRVLWMVQKIDDMSTVLAEKIKTIDYEYDSEGSLKRVIFQKHIATEYFAHEYTYDTDKRLINVTTSEDGVAWEQQAHYYYYQHGPLKRVELADELQGIDYIYTTTGWLKAINSPNLGATSGSQFIDPGKDGITNNFATDVFGMSIDYFSGDYKRTGSHVNYGISKDENYNGNIKSVRWNTEELGNPSTGNHWMYAYNYNKKGWLKKAAFGEYTHESCQNSSTYCIYPLYGNNHNLFGVYANNAYQVADVTYDNNGNILTLKRNAYGTNGMDDFVYSYKPNTNQLLHLADNPAFTSNWTTDLDNSTFTFDDQDNATWDYEYDELGQLIKNKKDNHYFEYNVRGLVTHIYNDAAKTDLLTTYHYDDKGYRYKKVIYDNSTPVANTFYLRTVSGDIKCTYEQDLVTPSNSSQQYNINGTSRIGTYYKNGDYIYELTDHLGNVRATINRNKVANEAVVETYADYYPFGEQLPGRVNSGSLLYKYTYQGQFAEDDKETSYKQFEARLWDGRTGRWMSTDPADQFHSPYLGMGNNPISFMDPNGEFAFPDVKQFFWNIYTVFNQHKWGSTPGRLLGPLVGSTTRTRTFSFSDSFKSGNLIGTLRTFTGPLANGSTTINNYVANLPVGPNITNQLTLNRISAPFANDAGGTTNYDFTVGAFSASLTGGDPPLFPNAPLTGFTASVTVTPTAGDECYAFNIRARVTTTTTFRTYNTITITPLYNAETAKGPFQINASWWRGGPSIFNGGRLFGVPKMYKNKNLYDY